MTRRSVAILALVAVLGVTAFAAADSLRPTPRQEKTWLQGQLAQYNGRRRRMGHAARRF